jgi:perosamine synthetase
MLNIRQIAHTNLKLKTPKDHGSFIPYGRQWIDEDDIQAVVEVLRSDWLTTGPKVSEFEQAFTDFVGAEEAVAVNSGTAALHAAMYALGIGPGDEVILPPITFVATANAVVFQGGTPVFADVDPDTLLIDPQKVEDKITPRTKAIVAVDYAGHPCDYDALKTVAAKHGLFLVADACHSLGAEYKGRKVGTLADLTVFSFHPVKHITTGEGGMVVTNNTEFAEKMRRFRNHGINTDHRKRADQGTWYYEMEDLGYNYRITDIQCALGLSQLQKLPKFLEQRRKTAARYSEAFAHIKETTSLAVRSDVLHAFHLYVIKVDLAGLKIGRNRLFSNFRSEGIGVNVHYIPVHLHPFYMKRFHTKPGLCPVAEEAYEQILSLPMFPGITDEGIERVIKSITESINQKSESCWEKWEKHIELR